eukprot:13916961-Alexandrium_andersonii.AAC.1
MGTAIALPRSPCEWPTADGQTLPRATWPCALAHSARVACRPREPSQGPRLKALVRHGSRGLGGGPPSPPLL